MAKYFTLKELCESPTAKARGSDNFPTFTVAAHLEELTKKILDPLREAWGSAIRVTSGYRCKQLNTAIGGALRSAHLEGYAADMQPYNGKTEEFIAFAKQWCEDNHIKFDQFIRETTKDKRSVWLHIGLYGPGGTQRKQYKDLVKP